MIGLIAVSRAGAVLRCGRVAGDLGVGVEPVFVTIEFRVLDDDRPTGVGARVAERAVFHPRVVDRDVAHLEARADVHAGVVEVARVDLVPRARSLGVGGEDPVGRGAALPAEIGGCGRQVAARVAVQADRAAVGAAVPPDPVARLACTPEEIAGCEVLDAHVVRLRDQDPVTSVRLAVGPDCPEVLLARIRAARTRRAGLGPVDDHRAAVHAAQVNVRLRDQHPTERAVRVARGRMRDVGRLVVVTGRDQQPIARAGSVDGGLNRRVLPGVTLVRPDEQHPPALRLGRTRRRTPRGERHADERARTGQRAEA